MKPFRSSLSTILFISASVFSTTAQAENNNARLAVGITPTLQKVKVLHQGQAIDIQRNQNPKNRVKEIFAKTSRKCPPFCIQPINLAAGVETIGELEILEYLAKIAKGDMNTLVIDSRTESWVKNGTIPGSINIPWTRLMPTKEDDDSKVRAILTGRFGVKYSSGTYDFSNAKTLTLFCNGMWCGQSANNINSLIKLGYPANKLKWYRGGMQDWAILGLTTIK